MADPQGVPSDTDDAATGPNSQATGTFAEHVAVAAPIRRRGGIPLSTWAQTRGGGIWLDALWVWGATRLLFLVLTYLIPALLKKGSAHFGSVLAPFAAWVTQDGYHFAEIARNGYGGALWRTGFWPLFPLLEHVAGPLFGGNYGLAGIAIANLAFLGALVVLRALAGNVLGAEGGRRAILYLALFPTAFYFFAPYSESLFLLLSIGSFAAMRSRRWLLAGVLGGLATLTRSAGVLLLAPFAVEFVLAWRASRARWWQLASAALIPAGVGVYSLYLKVAFGRPLAFQSSEQVWNRGLQPPWAIFVYTFTGLSANPSGHLVTWLHTLLNFVVLLAFGVLAVLAVRVLPPSFAVYAIVTALYLLVFPVSNPSVATQSDARYVLTMFPAFLVLAAWRRPARLHETLLMWMPAVLAVLCAEFLLGLANG